MSSADSKPNPHSPVIVTGATSQIGYFLLPRLFESGFEVSVISRSGKSVSGEDRTNEKWFRQDITGGLDTKKMDRSLSLIHIAPLPLLPNIIKSVSRLGVKRIVAFGSTSVFTKKGSPSKAERETVQKLADAEHAFQGECERHNIAWTLFRPTLIYGCGLDKNVTSIANFIRSYGFFPVAGAGDGLRQPVHADDLASACVAALASPGAINRSYNLSGGEVLSYRSMVEKIFIGLEKKPRVISIPLPMLRLSLRLARLILPSSDITAEIADRMIEDLCFDYDDAKHDFGYSPRGFVFG